MADDFWAQANELPIGAKVPLATSSASDQPIPFAKKFHDYMLSQGASKNEAALLTSAAYTESRFNPTALHDRDENGNPTGFGMFGHRLDRRDALFNFAQQNKSDPADWQTQGRFALQELRSRPEAAMVASAKTPEDLAKAQMFYERPQGFTEANPAGGLQYGERLGVTQALLNGQFTNLPQQTGSVGSPYGATASNPYGQLDAHLNELFPALGQQTTGATPSLDFAKNIPIAPAKQTSYDGAIGMFRSFAGGALPGLAGPAAGIAMAGRDAMQGRPLGAVASDLLIPQLSPSAKVSAPPYIQQGMDYVDKVDGPDLENYRASGGAPVLAQLAGETAGAMGASGLAGKGAQTVARLAGDISPELGTAARGVANFLGGTGGSNWLGKRASDAASGALQGAIATPFAGGSAVDNALAGGVLGPIAGQFIRPLTDPLRGTALPQVAQSAQLMAKNGVNVPGAAILDDMALKKSVESMAGKGSSQGPKELTNFVAKQIGADPLVKQFGGLTPDAFEANLTRIKGGLDNFAQTAGVAADNKLLQDVDAVRQWANPNNILDDKARNLVHSAIDKIEYEISHALYSPNQMLTGKQYQQLTDTKSSVIQQLYDNKTGVLNTAASQLRTALDDALERASPQNAAEIADLRKQYRISKAIEPIVYDKGSSTTGILDPKKLASRLSEENGVVGDVSRAGAFLPSLDAAGASKGSHLTDSHATPAMGLVAGGLGGHLITGPMEGWIEHLSNPLMLGGMAAGYGASMAARKAAGAYYGSPAFRDRVIQNTLNPQSSYLVNPLSAAGAALNPEWTK